MDINLKSKKLEIKTQKRIWIKRFCIGFFTFTAISSLVNRMGQIPNLPPSYEITWYTRLSLKTPIFCTSRKFDRSQFMDIVALQDASNNHRVKKLNIVLDSTVKFSYMQAQELVSIIMNFRKNKKEVHIWANSISTMPEFLIFSACTKRYLKSIEGVVWIKGFSIVGAFYKNWLKKKKIDVIGGQGGDYKGGLSINCSHGFDYYFASNRRCLIEDFAQQARILLSQILNVSCLQVESWMQTSWFNSHEAVAAGLVDEIGNYERSANEVDLQEYINRLVRYSRHFKNLVFVVNIDFPLMGYVCDLFARELTDMAYDNSIKVVLLLIDCPGGQVEAITKIDQAIQLMRKRGKYVIAVVDNLAASGGYILASGADKIFTRQGSVIGSIGAYYEAMDDTRRLKHKGIDLDRIYTHHPVDNIDEHSKEFLDRNLQKGYADFKDQIRERRKLSYPAIEDIGNGQVFSGAIAYSLGLVDSLDGYAGAFALIDSMFNHEAYAFIFIPNEFVIRRWLKDI